MILSEHSNRILTVNFKADGYMQLVSVKPNEDPTKIKVTQMSMSDDDQKKLVQAIMDNFAKEENKGNHD